MRALDWYKLFQEYAREHDKHVFTLTELLHLSGATPEVLRVTIHRLKRQGVIAQLAHGLYGPATVAPEALLPYLDPCAYITGFPALHHHGHIDQVPTVSTCFTNRRHSSRLRRTSAGRFQLLTITAPVYSFPGNPIALPEQALYDYVYLCRLEGIGTRGLTFRRLHELHRDALEMLGERYPRTVRDNVAAILETARQVG